MSLTSNIIFFGTPPFAARSLEAILGSKRTVSLVVTQPQRPSGRGLQLKSSAVFEWAKSHDIPVVSPKKLKDPTFVQELKKTAAQIFVVAAYGRILPKEILDLPKMTLNVHGSLLPRWRGAAPIQRAILQGDPTTGISIMRLVEEMDAGDYMLQKKVEVGENETYGEVENKLAELGAKALMEALDLLDRDQAKFMKQDPYQVTYAPPIKASETKIDWGCMKRAVHRQVLAFSPTPGAHTFDGKVRIKIFKTQLSSLGAPLKGRGSLWVEKNRLWIACADGWVEVLEIQREGKARQMASQFLSGYRAEGSSQWT